MNDIIVKKADKNILKELKTIKFDSSYIETAKKKYSGGQYKIFNLKPYEANILKQICLSLGFDCAVSRETVMCTCDSTDCIVFASNSQLIKLIEKLNSQPFRLKKLASSINSVLSDTLLPLKIRSSLFDWKNSYVMGIVNATPDSFSDGGKYNSCDKVFEHILRLIDDGADIIDIGGQSTRPSASEIDFKTEINRVLPIIKKLRKEGINIPVSIDTIHYETAAAAIEAGADIINDVSGLDYDENLYKYVSENNIPVVIMHSDKIPASNINFTTSDIVEEVYFSLYRKINMLLDSGMKRNNIIIDVGVGFGKDAAANFELLRRIEEFKTLNQPVLLGISRKSFMKNEFNISTDDEVDDITSLYSAMLSSVNIHRVHNVKLVKKYLTYSSKLF